MGGITHEVISTSTPRQPPSKARREQQRMIRYGKRGDSSRETCKTSSTSEPKQPSTVLRRAARACLSSLRRYRAEAIHEAAHEHTYPAAMSLVPRQLTSHR